ncbi:MAG: SRPBCC family protein [Pseudomonadota bacterium]
MRILKWLLGIVVVLAIIFVAGGMLLPREVTVARSIQIDAPPQAVFPHVNSLKATEGWSPWLERDPNVQLSYNDTEAGVGAAMEWASDEPTVGTGKQEIIESNENESVVTALDFGDMGLAQAKFLLDDTGGATTITWTLDTDMGAGPMGRWMGLMMDSWVGGDYEQGLVNLKALVEGQ